MKKRNQKINNNKKEKPSYAKMFKEQIKKESNKSNISNKNENNNEDKPNEKQEINNLNVGINFDKLSDWDNIVYPDQKETKNIINKEKEEDNNHINNQNISKNNENDNINNYQQLGLNAKNLEIYNDNNLINRNEQNQYLNKLENLNDFNNAKEPLENHNNINILNGNNFNQIHPLDFKLGKENDINNVIKEEDSLEEDNNMKDNKNNINDNDIDNIKDQRDIMEQMEEEMNLSMNQMNELAGNLQGSLDNININKKASKQNYRNKNKKIYLKNTNSSKGNIENNKNNININKKIINANVNNIVNKEIKLDNLNKDSTQTNYFNSNNFSFKPTNIQQVSSEEVNKFIQNTQQKSLYPQDPINRNNNINQIPIYNNNFQQQINSCNYPKNNMESQNQVLQNSPIPLYPSSYPKIVGPNTNSPHLQMPNMINMNQIIYQNGNIYPYPAQNCNNPQFPISSIPQNTGEIKNEKRKVNYKPKSLKEYKEKYNNGIKEHRGGLGANIGGEEWEHKKEKNMKVKKYSEMIKNQNKEKENNFKKKINNFKIKNELNEQLYDSLSDEVMDEPQKEKKPKISENIKEKDRDKERRPESNKVKYLMQLKKEKEKEKNNKSNEKKPKQGKYSNYTKIVIESIDKGTNPNTYEKKLGKIYTTFKPKQQRRPSTKDKNKLIKPIINNENNKRSQSTGYKNQAYQKNEYDDELTKQFMSPNPNNYNGFINNKDNYNNFMISPTVEIE